MNTTHLKINGISKISIGQFKKRVVRIVLANKKNMHTSIEKLKSRIIITIHNLERQKNIKKENKKKEIINKYIDRKGSIRSINTSDNKIIVVFNKKPGKFDIRYTNKKNKKSFEDIFEIKGTYKYANPIKLKINGLDKISIGQKNNKVKIRIINKKDIKVYYNKERKKLTIRIVGLKKKKTLKKIKKEEEINNNNLYPAFKRKTIVIDAGHGGKDAGAVGPHKRYEKDVVYNVSKYLYSILKKRGHKVYLTRTKDKFIKVTNRTILANKKHADIFISVHANSVPKSKASKIHGIETFFLSPARNERAKRVAAKENSFDIKKMSNASKSAFLESLNRPRITASHKLAIDVQSGILQSVKKKYKDVRDSGVREGPFWVLVGAQMPSILIELGYISHPIESKRLVSSSYQKLLANGIASGVDAYFLKN